MNTDQSNASTLTNPGFNLDYDKSNGELDGITFTPGGNDSSSETNAVDEFAVIVVDSYANSQTDLCSAIGDSGCTGESGQTNQGSDVTDLPYLLNDLGPSVLATEIDTDPTERLSLNSLEGLKSANSMESRRSPTWSLRCGPPTPGQA